MNSNCTATITSLSHDGRGISRIDGKTIFIDGALPEELVEFAFTKRHSNFDEAKTVAVLKSSPHRVPALCPHFGVCGGCSLQHLAHDEQLKFKEQVVLEQLAHFGHQSQIFSKLPPLSGAIWNYRYKARLSAKFVAKKNKLLLGFHEKNGRFVADINECPVLHSAFSNKIAQLRDVVAGLSVYQSIPQIEIACGTDAAALVIRHLLPLTKDDQASLIELSNVNDFTLYLQPKGLDSIHLAGSDEKRMQLLCYQIPSEHLELFFSPLSFTQVNYALNQLMIARVLDLLNLETGDSVLDLFCGIGNFTLPIAKHSLAVTGVEGSEEAVRLATMNAKHNAINNAVFYCADLNGDFSSHTWAAKQYDKIVLDPPRSGISEKVLQLLKAQRKASKIVYVSCNPATFARDTGFILQAGYALQRLGIADMFPHTKHIEVVAEFER